MSSGHSIAGTRRSPNYSARRDSYRIAVRRGTRSSGARPEPIAGVICKKRIANLCPVCKRSRQWFPPSLYVEHFHGRVSLWRRDELNYLKSSVTTPRYLMLTAEPPIDTSSVV